MKSCKDVRGELQLSSSEQFCYDACRLVTFVASQPHCQALSSLLLNRCCRVQKQGHCDEHPRSVESGFLGRWAHDGVKVYWPVWPSWLSVLALPQSRFMRGLLLAFFLSHRPLNPVAQLWCLQSSSLVDLPTLIFWAVHRWIPICLRLCPSGTIPFLCSHSNPELPVW